MRTIYEQLKQIEQPVGGFINPKKVPYTVLPCESMPHEHEDMPTYLLQNYLRILYHYIDTEYSNSVLQGTLRKIKQPHSLILAKQLVYTVDKISDEALKSLYSLIQLMDSKEDVLTLESLETLTENDLENIKMYIVRYNQFKEMEEGPFRHLIRYAETPNVYSDTIEMISGNCIWNIVVSQKVPTKNQFLQLLIEFILYVRSVGQGRIDAIGIYNPKSQTIYKVPVSSIDSNLFYQLQKDVLGYPDDECQIIKPLARVETQATKIYTSQNIMSSSTKGMYYAPKKQKKSKKLFRFFKTILFLILAIFIIVIIVHFTIGDEVLISVCDKINQVYGKIRTFLVNGELENFPTLFLR